MFMKICRIFFWKLAISREKIFKCLFALTYFVGIFPLLVVEERAASSGAKPRAREECGQPGISEECPSAVHFLAIWQ